MLYYDIHLNLLAQFNTIYWLKLNFKVLVKVIYDCLYDEKYIFIYQHIASVGQIFQKFRFSIKITKKYRHFWKI